MTPKKKAQELFDKYYIICQEFTEEIQCSIQAEQCALVAVDEQISLLLSLSPYMAFPNQVTYLQEVKQEIEKL
jgi:hypothetical protein